MISTLILYSKTHALCTPDLGNGVLIRHRLRCFAISWGFISQLSEGLLRWSKLSPSRQLHLVLVRYIRKTRFTDDQRSSNESKQA